LVRFLEIRKNRNALAMKNYRAATISMHHSLKYIKGISSIRGLAELDNEGGAAFRW